MKIKEVLNNVKDKPNKKITVYIGVQGELFYKEYIDLDELIKTLKELKVYNKDFEKCNEIENAYMLDVTTNDNEKVKFRIITDYKKLN